MDIEKLIKTVVQCIYNVRGILMQGYLESVYKRALMVELERCGFKTESEKTITVFYKGIEVGFFRADLVVEDCLIVELKAVENLTKAHEVQLVNYLTATGIENGLLVNFGENFAIKRKFRAYRQKNINDIKTQIHKGQINFCNLCPYVFLSTFSKNVSG